jgi:5-carboxymethyl-2-hydroxymuconate isomerase
MPHLVLEHSTNIAHTPDFQLLFSRMHWVLTELGAFKLADLKSRVHPCDTYYIADGDANNAFVHLRFEILEGRTADIKHQAGDRLMALLKEAFAATAKERNCLFSIEIRDMAREGYFK